MSTLLQLAETVWAESQTYEFGGAESWDESLFTASWASRKGIAEAWSLHKSGWYWFETKCILQEFSALMRPELLPQNGVDFGSTTAGNLDLFKEERLCQPDDDGWRVVYNGHEGNISGRVRAHFNLNNDKTGALGLKHYDISRWHWRVRLFSTCNTSAIPELERQAVATLSTSTIGRGALETIWRGIHGWPFLCRK